MVFKNMEYLFRSQPTYAISIGQNNRFNPKLPKYPKALKGIKIVILKKNEQRISKANQIGSIFCKKIDNK